MSVPYMFPIAGVFVVARMHVHNLFQNPNQL